MADTYESIKFWHEFKRQIFPKRLPELNNAYYKKKPSEALSAFYSDADLSTIVIDLDDVCRKYDIQFIENDTRYGFRAIKGGNIFTPKQNPKGDKTSYVYVEFITKSGYVPMYLPWENKPPKDKPDRSIAVFLKVTHRGQATEKEADAIVDKMIKALG